MLDNSLDKLGGWVSSPTLAIVGVGGLVAGWSTRYSCVVCSGWLRVWVLGLAPLGLSPDLVCEGVVRGLILAVWFHGY